MSGQLELVPKPPRKPPPQETPPDGPESAQEPRETQYPIDGLPVFNSMPQGY